MAFSATRMLMAAGGRTVAPSFNVYASNFDTGGSASYLSINGTSLTNSSTGILSFWVNLANTTTGVSHYPFENNNTGVQVQITGGSPPSVNINLQNSTGSLYYSLSVASVTLTANTWYNFMLSWNMNFAAGSKICTLYINNVAPSSSASDTHAAFTVGYSDTYTVSQSGTALNGCISELYFAPGQFLDFTISGNRALFYNAGVPVNLGSSGQTPTSTSPAIYWKGQYTSLTNLGTLGGSFTNNGDTITACGSIP